MRLGSMGHLHCFNADNGEVVWKKDLNAEYNIRMPVWGIASAPIIDGGLVIVQIGGSPGACIVALDRKTGEEQWESARRPRLLRRAYFYQSGW